MTDTATGIVDAHHHLWDLAERPQPWTAELPVLQRSFTFDDLTLELDRHGIARTVLVQTVPDPTETPEMLAFAVTEPRVAGVVGWVDLTRGDVADRLAQLRTGRGGEKLLGIRHLVSNESDPRWLARSDVRRGLAAVAAAGLVYDVLVWHHQLPSVVETVAAVTDLRFVLDHGGKPAVRDGWDGEWAAAVTALSHHANVAVKLSGLLVEASGDHRAAQAAPFAAHLLESFGPERCLYGSDWPVCLLSDSYSDVYAAASNWISSCTPNERAAVLGGTAQQWYEIQSS